jgi:hypothetical protein
MRNTVILAGLIAVGATPGLAQDPACYALETPSKAHGVKTLTLTDDGKINYTLIGSPYVTYEFSCDFGGKNVAYCPVECDGGSLTLIRFPEGVLADFSGLRVESARIESIATQIGAMEADGAVIGGLFQLKPADTTVCEAAAELRQPLLLEPGDLYPAVERLEKYLFEGGYFNDVADWYFTEDTAEAVRQFQAEYGDPVTGLADWALLQKIGIYATYSFGGC